MEERKQNLLKLIIENYIETAEPIGSKFLVEQADLDVSGATVRNEMRELEEEGYLTHPHTSAGRIPTDLGYQYYVDNLMKVKELRKHDISELQTIRNSEKNPEAAMKLVGKFSADRTGAAVIISYGPDSVYYTGISYLFLQPEFLDHSHMVSISSIFDHCEEHMRDVYRAVGEAKEPKTLIGKYNPLGSACSLTITRLPNDVLFTIMSPLRTDYARNLALLEKIRTLF
jgi:transcriptional regulator of heat shock response